MKTHIQLIKKILKTHIRSMLVMQDMAFSGWTVLLETIPLKVSISKHQLYYLSSEDLHKFSVSKRTL